MNTKIGLYNMVAFDFVANATRKLLDVRVCPGTFRLNNKTREFQVVDYSRAMVQHF